jgi:hypothetical protein
LTPGKFFECIRRGRFLVDPHATLVDRFYRLEQGRKIDPFENVTHRSALGGVQDAFVLRIGGQDQYFGRRAFLLDIEQSLHDVAFRHLEIQKQDIRFGALKHSYDLVSTGGFSYHQDVLFSERIFLIPSRKSV